MNGSLTISTDGADWVEFINLLGGSPFTLKASTGAVSFFPNVAVRSDTQAPIASGFFQSGSDANLGGSVPLDGNLLVGVTTGEGSGAYTLTLQTGVPEPGTLATMGLTLAGALAYRRKRNR